MAPLSNLFMLFAYTLVHPWLAVLSLSLYMPVSHTGRLTPVHLPSAEHGTLTEKQHGLLGQQLCALFWLLSPAQLLCHPQFPPPLRHVLDILQFPKGNMVSLVCLPLHTLLPIQTSHVISSIPPSEPRLLPGAFPKPSIRDSHSQGPPPLPLTPF